MSQDLLDSLGPLDLPELLVLAANPALLVPEEIEVLRAYKALAEIVGIQGVMGLLAPEEYPAQLEKVFLDPRARKAIVEILVLKVERGHLDLQELQDRLGNPGLEEPPAPPAPTASPSR